MIGAIEKQICAICECHNVELIILYTRTTGSSGAAHEPDISCSTSVDVSRYYAAPLSLLHALYLLLACLSHSHGSVDHLKQANGCTITN